MQAGEVFSHKFFAPPVYPGAIHRDELLGRIFREPTYGVVVVQAPAGHGKSTVLQQAKSASEAGGAVTGWLSFDEADNDMRRFSAHIQALIETLVSLPESAGGAPAVRQRLSDWIAGALFRTECKVHLFLDEFQALNNEGALGTFADLLERIPENVTLFIGSRAIPEIGLARLVVNNQALVLRAEDLRFSRRESEVFFSQSADLGLTAEELDAIYRQTEGWPAALQLFRLSLASPSVREALGDLKASRPRELAEYLADNVLALQPPRIQEFLLRSSVLTRLSAGLCDFVLGWQDSQSILLFLERSGLFLRCLDSDLRWFRYHTLFSSFMGDQLQLEHGQDVREIHRRAAQWFERHGMLEDAVHHAIMARDYGFAADTLGAWADSLILDAELSTIEGWSDRLPLKEIAARPELAIKICWALIFLRRHHKLRPIMASLEQAGGDGLQTDVLRSMLALVEDDMPKAFEIVECIDVSDAGQAGFRAFELAAAANARGFRALSAAEFEAARENLVLARTHNLRSESAFSGAYTVAVSGMSLMLQGRLQEAVEGYRSGLASHRLNLEKSFAAASLVSCYVHALYEADELGAAESMFRQFHDVISDCVLLDFLAQGYISMVRIQQACGDTARAEALLAEAEDIAHMAAWPRLLRVVAWERVRRALMDGDLSRAQVIASRIAAEPEFRLPNAWMIFSEAIEGDAIGAIRLLIHEGQGHEAASRLATEITQAQRSERSYRLIKLLVLDALNHWRRDNQNHAHRSLQRALQLAEPGGFVRVFLDEGKDVLLMLVDAYQALGGDAASPSAEDAAQCGFIARLLESAGEQDRVHRPAPGEARFQPLEALTDRELQILAALADGAPNKEVARRVFVSENTVKFHLKNIYSKLGVSSRMQAINAARQMGLIA